MTTYTSQELRDGVRYEARKNLGHDYRDSAVPTNWPPAQFDCSTFVRWCWTKFGVDPDRGRAFTDKWPEREPRPWRKYPGYTMTQLAVGKRAGAEIDFKDVEVGDALYYSDAGGRPYHHVVIYIGDGKVTHAAGTAYGVITTPVVRPGSIGHGGKKFVGAISLVKMAKAVGAWEADPVPPVQPTPALASIDISAVRKAFKTKGKHPDVLKVHRALKKVGIHGGVASKKAGRGKRRAYAKWQRRLGYTGNDANGIPGAKSLRKLARRTGYRVTD